MKRTYYPRIVIFCIAIGILCVVGCAVENPVKLQAFYGTAKVSGNPAQAGMLVEARGEGVLTGTGENPVAVVTEGIYGGSGSYERKLIVEGTVVADSPLEFYIDGVRAEVSIDNSTWTSTFPFSSGTITQLHLRTGEILIPLEILTSKSGTDSSNDTTPTSTYLAPSSTDTNPSSTYLSDGNGGEGGDGGGTNYDFSTTTTTVSSSGNLAPTPLATTSILVTSTTQPVGSLSQSLEPAPQTEFPVQGNEPAAIEKSGQSWNIFGIPVIWIAGLIGAIVIANVSVVVIMLWRQREE